MSRPLSVTILGHDIPIEYKVYDPEDDHPAEFDPKTKKIILSEYEFMLEDLDHEISHAVLYFSGITNLLDEETEEAVVSALSFGRLNLYKRNF